MKLVVVRGRKILYGSAQRSIVPIRPSLFGFFSASGHQKLLRTAKRPNFSVRFYKNRFGKKTIQNQYEHRIGRVVAILGIHHFPDPELFKPLYLPPHIILTILGFFSQPDSFYSWILKKAGQKKS
jgi:hypothetical protein